MSGHVLPGSTENHSAHDGLAQSQVRRYGPLRFARSGSQPNGPDGVLGGSGVTIALSSWGTFRLGVLAVARSPRSTFRRLTRPVIVSSRPALGMQARSILVPATGPLASLSVPVAVVVLLGPDPEVGGIHARGIVTAVQYVRGLGGDISVHQDPREPMGPNRPTKICGESVPSIVPSTRPQPARAKIRNVNENGPVLIDLAPESNADILLGSHRRVSSCHRDSGGQGRSGATNTLAVRSFYQFSAENPNKSARKAA